MGIFLSFLSGVALFYLFPYFPAVTVITFIASSLFIIFKRNPLLLALILIGFLYTHVRYIPPADTSGLAGKEVVVECVTEDSPRLLPSGKSGNRVRVMTAADPETKQTLADLKGREMDVSSDRGLPWNSRCELLIKMGRDSERLNPGIAGEKRLYAWLEAIGRTERGEAKGPYFWLRERREELNLYFRRAFQGDPGAFLSSITTGERTELSEEMNDAFGRSGLAHLLSISGTHFGLFSMLVFGIFRIALYGLPYRFLQRFTVWLTPSQAAALLSLPFMLLYLLISDLSFPAVRSFIMITLFLFGLLLGRKGFWLNTLLFAAFLICLWDPSALLNLSFQLSFLAVLFIGFTSGEKKRSPRDQGLIARVAGILKDSLLLSLSAALGTAPLVAYSFHYFSVVSPVSNLLVTPFIGFVLVFLSLFSSFIFIFSGYFPFQPLIAGASDLSLKAVKFFAAVPFADIKIPAFPLIVLVFFYSGCLLYLLGKRKTAAVSAAAAIAVAIVTFTSGEKGLSVTYLDVGQGDSAVIESPGGRTMVIDTGKTGREAEAFLKYRGKRVLDVLLITHADDDHSAGAPRLLSRFRVREVWDNGLLIYPEDLISKVLHRGLERGDDIRAGELQVLTLHPYKGFYTMSGSEATAENNDSLVVKVTGKRSFLFTADTAEEAEEDMARLGSVLRSDVLKVSHHGSRTSSSEHFLALVSPEIAVISVGRDNLYGHPHRETLDRLGNMRIFRMDRDGAVKITERADGFAVKTGREFRFEHAGDLSGEWRNVKRLFEVW